MLQCQTGIAKYHIRNSEIYHYLWLSCLNGSSQILCIADTAFTKPNDFTGIALTNYINCTDQLQVLILKNSLNYSLSHTAISTAY